MQNDSRVAMVLVAAGRGYRAGGDIPKQYRRVAGQTVLTRTLRATLDALPGSPVQVVIHPDDLELYQTAIAELDRNADNLLTPAWGGDTRQTSARLGLEKINQLCADAKYVLIHDVARPFLSYELTSSALKSAEIYGATVPACRLTDTVKQVDASGTIVATPPRETLRTVQTPQAFRLDLILDAHRRAVAAGLNDFSDDAAVAEWAGHPVHVFEGDPANMKLTNPEDFALAEARLMNALGDIRVGQGFDVHAFGPGDHVWLGGVQIPHTAGLVGHSDADVVLHAVTDALLGAIADGDIGAHFPPSDPKWRGAASEIFLKEAVRRVAARGGAVSHLDVTIICEVPKVGPHRDAIRARIAEIAGLALDRVAVKATTTEKLGFTGRREGIATTAVATVRLPFPTGA